MRAAALHSADRLASGRRFSPFAGFPSRGWLVCVLVPPVCVGKHADGSQPVAYALWCAVRRYSSATWLCGASGTRYVTMRGLTGRRRVPSG
eukprot:718192-Prymnesium_polylepis.1